MDLITPETQTWILRAIVSLCSIFACIAVVMAIGMIISKRDDAAPIGIAFFVGMVVAGIFCVQFHTPLPGTPSDEAIAKAIAKEVAENHRPASNAP